MCKRFPPPRWRHTAGIRRAERERKKGGRNIKSKRGNEYIDDLNLLVLWNTKRDNKLLCISKDFAVDFTSWIRIKTNERSSWTVSWTYFQYVVLQGARLDFDLSRPNWKLDVDPSLLTATWIENCFWKDLLLDFSLMTCFTWTLELYRFLLRQDLRPDLVLTDLRSETGFSQT